MTLRKPGSADEVARRRDRMMAEAEEKMAEASAAATRQFLRRIQAHVTEDALTAAGEVPPPSELFTLGQAHGWWEEAVDEHVSEAVASVWRTGYLDARDGELLASDMAAQGEFIANVKDRLSRTATPTVPEQAMNRARVALAEEMTLGSNTRTVSQRLAAEFGWDEHAGFWRGRLGELDSQVDRVLDGYGPPGSEVRNTARLADPQVRALQAQRAEARRHIDTVESEWQTRADRIARTESTSAFNAGSLDAYRRERAGAKVWIATGDDRTRDDHLDAHGQCVPVDDDFRVGGFEMQMPGDPSAPPEQVVNCRCTTVASESCDQAAEDYTMDVGPIAEERLERAGFAGQDFATPETFEAGGSDTRGLHGTTAPGGFRYNRARVDEVHEPYFSGQLSTGVATDEPQAVFMGGGPASGKSRLIDAGLVRLPRGHVTVNPDDAKGALPEYRAARARKHRGAAPFVHEESSDMAKTLTERSLGSGYHTVLDGTGDGTFDKLAAKVARARADGAKRIVGEYVTVDTDEAVRRSVSRMNRTGRGVPESVVRGTHARVSEVFPQAARADLYDELRLFDTNGDTTRLIYEKVAGVEQIHDPEAYQRFLAKAAQ